MASCVLCCLLFLLLSSCGGDGGSSGSDGSSAVEQLLPGTDVVPEGFRKVELTLTQQQQSGMFSVVLSLTGSGVAGLAEGTLQPAEEWKTKLPDAVSFSGTWNQGVLAAGAGVNILGVIGLDANCRDASGSIVMMDGLIISIHSRQELTTQNGSGIILKGEALSGKLRLDETALPTLSLDGAEVTVVYYR